ncbi:MAG: SagB/ThcOx family dehydrogenase [Chloroflexi bacterium]|nr:SagB/ThcOx family dehydrogenase [Chloroflexota bacterium]MBL7061920.1 SagB/ThcOx family dehydrogenase [Dehalococcoidia bacterium]
MVRTKEAPIKLPSLNPQGKVSVEAAISKRRSVRRFRAQPLSLAQLSQLLWSAQGITGSGGRRAVPSAGATYPLEIFVVIGAHGIESLAAGIYHYQADTHSLSLYLSGDLRQKLADAALGQGFVANCPVVIVVCALHPRTAYRYGRRGERYIHMEVGHVGQNVSLQAVALGLATVMVGAFEDEEVRKALKIEEQIKPLYIIPVGEPV